VDREPMERLIRIMGTFDLATGHADTFDELLTSLESELSDVLGHYREALKVNEQQIKDIEAHLLELKQTSSSRQHPEPAPPG